MTGSAGSNSNTDDMKPVLKNIKHGLRATRTSGLALFVVIAFVVLIVLGFQIRNQLRALQSAPTDNVQWNFSQLEVELLRLTASVVQTQGEADLRQMRQRFDLFFSRVDIVTSSHRIYEPDCTSALCKDMTALREFTADMATLMDGGDQPLLAAKEEIILTLQAYRSRIRALSLQAVSFFVAAADARRAALSFLLATTATVAAFLFLALNIAFFILFRTYQTSVRRGNQSRRAKSRLQSTVGASLDAVLVLDERGILLDYNGAAERVFGHRREDILGQDIGRLIPSEEYRHLFNQRLKSAKSPLAKTIEGRFQLRACRNTGEEFPAEATIARANGEKGPIYVSFIHDISERERVRLDLVKARDDALAAERAKSDFIAVMSHEMRTPLNGVLATLELLASSELNDQQAAHVAIAQTSGDRLLSHIDDVLQISSIESGANQPVQQAFAPLEVIESLVERFGPMVKSQGNTLSADGCSPAVGTVIGDAARLETILQNLVGNANKFTRDGTISITMQIESHDQHQVNLKFGVSDTGRGIPAEKQAQIFDDFVSLDSSYRRETEGTGLGLGIARRLARVMQGDIEVQSTPGTGTIFWVHLPFKRSETQPQADPTPAAPTETPRQGLKVLVVEDNDINRSIAREMLVELSAKVSEASNGKEGVAAAQARCFDLILMDISMPIMDGLEATAKIRASGASSQAPIFGFTAHAQPEKFAQFKQAGMQHILTKPITRAQIRAALLYLGNDDQTGDNIPPQVAGPAAALINMGHMNEMRDVLGDTAYKAALQRYRLETTTAVNGLNGATPPLSQEDRAAEFHKLAGAAATMGAIKFHHLLQKAETAVLDRTQPDVTLEKIQSCWQQTEQALAQTINSANQ